MVEIAEAMQIAQAAGFSPEISEEFTINGALIYGHIEEGYHREENSVGSVAYQIRIRQEDLAETPVAGKTVVWKGVTYRMGNGAYPSGGDWIIPLVKGYVQA